MSKHEKLLKERKKRPHAYFTPNVTLMEKCESEYESNLDEIVDIALAKMVSTSLTFVDP